MLPELIDPDRILRGMLGYLGWIFTGWFLAVIVGHLRRYTPVLTHINAMTRFTCR